MSRSFNVYFIAVTTKAKEFRWSFSSHNFLHPPFTSRSYPNVPSLCRIWGSHSGTCEESYLLVYITPRTLLKVSLCWLLTNYTALYTRRQNSSTLTPVLSVEYEVSYPYSDWLRAGRHSVRSSSPGMGQEYSPRRPDRLWGPLNLLSNVYWGLFPRG
jgi:hypothetical protein